MTLRAHSPSVILNTSLKKYLLLNFITGGLYFYVIQNRLNWVFSHLNMPEQSRSMKNSVIAMWSSLGAFIILTSFAAMSPDRIQLMLAGVLFPSKTQFVLAGLGFFMLFIVLQVVWSFQCRRAFALFCQREQLSVLPPNVVFILFIPGVILVRAINRLNLSLKYSS